MAVLRRMITIAVFLTVSFAIQTANLYYDPVRIENTQEKQQFVVDSVKINDRILLGRFPYEIVDYALKVPSNMTYTSAEFQQFKGTYLEQAKTARDESYFEGMVFAGDSLTYGLGRNKGSLLGDYDVVAYGNLDVLDYATFNTSPMYNQSEELKTSLEWISYLKPKAIYLLLGTNGVYVWTNAYHINYYNKLLDKITEASPESEIVLVSVTPWGQSRENEDFNNQKIDHFNMLLLSMAKSRGCYYLNMAEVFKDENGCLKTDFGSSDGVHWQTVAKKAYLDYIKSHPIPTM